MGFWDALVGRKRSAGEISEPSESDVMQAMNQGMELGDRIGITMEQYFREKGWDKREDTTSGPTMLGIARFALAERLGVLLMDYSDESLDVHFEDFKEIAKEFRRQAILKDGQQQTRLGS